jgi:vancomycin resistance protein VanJ
MLSTIRQFFSHILLALLLSYHTFLLLFAILRFLRVEWWWMALLNTFALWLFVPLLISLPLVVVLRAKRSRVYGLLALVCGAIFLIPAYAPLARPSAEPDTPTFTLITYNFLDSNREKDASVAWLRQSNADVLLLEEISSRNTVASLEPLRELYPYEAFIQGDNRILSKYPFLEEEVIQMTSTTPTRLALRVVIAPHDQPIALYSVHMWLPEEGKANIPVNLSRFPFLSRMPFSMMLSYNEKDRNANIRDILTRLATEPYPHIVAGDFNMSATSLIYGELDAVLDDAQRTAGSGMGMTWPVGNVLNSNLGLLPPLLRIDYVWYSAGLEALNTIVGEPIGSDHLPMTVTMAIQR